MITELQLKFKADTGTSATADELFDEDENPVEVPTREYLEWLEDLATKQINLKNNTCTLTNSHQDFMELKTTSCCGTGPITSENYCPNCGKKILRKL